MTTLKTSTGAQYARILGTGSHRGSRVVTNEEMCTMIDSTPEWIEQRTGIRERRWATKDETVLSMATDAGRKALDMAGVKPEQVGAIIVSTVSHHIPSPGLSDYLAEELGCPAPATFDISAACAGFCYALTLAESIVHAGHAGKDGFVLIVGVERLSDMTNMDDRGTAFLFGDGAGAAVVGPSDTPAIGPAVWGSKPANVKTIEIQSWTEADKNPTGFPLIQMDGHTVFKWALSEVADHAAEAIDAAGITPEQLDIFLPHQANDRITDAIIRHLHLPDSVSVCRDIAEMGNTSGASIPIAMDAMIREGRAKSGQTALIIGFGAGLVYAGQVVVLP